MLHLAERLQDGRARLEDVELLNTVARQIQGKCLCALGEFSTMPVVSAIANFRADFAARVADGR
jgi:NADH-quinone oxidoreductase subunit F